MLTVSPCFFLVPWLLPVLVSAGEPRVQLGEKAGRQVSSKTSACFFEKLKMQDNEHLGRRLQLANLKSHYFSETLRAARQSQFLAQNLQLPRSYSTHSEILRCIGPPVYNFSRCGCLARVYLGSKTSKTQLRTLPDPFPK